MITPLIDSYGRRIDYLRISLTDLCNFSCVYCVPDEGVGPLAPSHYLTRDEIARFVKISTRLGVRRVRLTGGEPLLRADLLEIVRLLKAIPEIKDLSITTNASRLVPMIKPLREAGLDRLNISLDSLRPDRFKTITLSDAYDQVIQALHLAIFEGFPVKLNVVALRGLTVDEILDFVRLAMNTSIEVRFLEFMPLCGTAWQADRVLPIRVVREIIREHFELKEEFPRLDNVAQTFWIEGSRGKVGFIGSLTESFCGACSRLRLTADGRIRPCLFSNKEISIKDLLRNGASDQEVIEKIQSAAAMKPKGNEFADRPFDPNAQSIPDPSRYKNPMIRVLGG